MKNIILLLMITIPLLLTGCGSHKAQDLTAIKKEIPRSILVMMPKNQTNDIKASYTVLANVTYPLAEAGYYVLPVVVTDEIFKQNGMMVADDIQAISPKKLYEIFKADAALYLEVTTFGTSYQIIQSDTRVTVSGKLVDLRSGKELWQGAATASSLDNDHSVGFGFIGYLLQVAATQIINTAFDKSYDISKSALNLLFTPTKNGFDGNLLFGPYSPNYETQHAN